MTSKFAPAFAAWLFCVFVSGPSMAQDTSATQAFSDAVTALRDGDEEGAFSLLPEGDRLSQDLLIWTQLRDRETQAAYASYESFLKLRPDWPGLGRLRASAERAIDDSISAPRRLSFFEGAEVETGEGAVALAAALTAEGRPAEAEAMLVETWMTTGLTRAGHLAMVNAHGDLLAPYHVDRADMLLWRWRSSDAQNVVGLLDEGEQALMRARMALIAKASDVRARENLVPDRLRDNAGLHYDRFNWFADRGNWTQATSIMTARSESAETLGVPWRWGSWRRILARWQMREGNAVAAYLLAANHFIQPDENNYSDLEWLSGYIALTYLKEYDVALAHFQRFDASVSSPISKGRAGYWMGRAYEGLGNVEAAISSFQAGAQHQTSFYGLLSAEKLGLTMNPDLIGGENFGDWRDGTLLRNELVRAGFLLLNAGERGSAVMFFVEAAKTLNRREVGQLGTLFMEMDEPFYAVLVAKAAARDGVIVHDVYFPLHPMALMDLPVDPALSLAIARQESEFREDAGSSVGALGIMQLMPATAEEVAGWLDLPFSRSRLTSDWQYNTTLGSEYLAYLTREFGDAPVMIAAGYNAGPSRPKSWMTERGDPRRGFANPSPVDVVDWIEHIPFRETRNYVMRVSEGIPVYRARLSGQIAPVAFTEILVGAAPTVRPRIRPVVSPTSAVQDAVEEALAPPVRPLPLLETEEAQSLRPVARTANN